MWETAGIQETWAFSVPVTELLFKPDYTLRGLYLNILWKFTYRTSNYYIVTLYYPKAKEVSPFWQTTVPVLLLNETM
jgi:hypothetical protein